MKPKANTLFHFTKSFDVLKLILNGGVKPQYCLEDVEWFDHAGENYLAYPMSCFCDIPLTRISEHTRFYGEYGIGLSKEWAINNNLNPVVYCTPNNPIINLARQLFKWADQDEHIELRDIADHELLKLASLIKPLSGRMILGEDTIQKDFYQENEWRYVPTEFDGLTQKDYQESKDHINLLLEEYKLKISPSDIKYIFLPTDKDIPLLVDYINSELSKYPLTDLKILQSRIISLQTLRDDF